MTYLDSGLRWCVSHGDQQARTAVRIGRIPADTPMCPTAIKQAWRAHDSLGRGREHLGDWPSPCRWVALLVDDTPVAVEGQGAMPL